MTDEYLQQDCIEPIFESFDFVAVFYSFMAKCGLFIQNLSLDIPPKMAPYGSKSKSGTVLPRIFIISSSKSTDWGYTIFGPLPK